MFLMLFNPVKASNQLKTESFSVMSFIVVLFLMLVNLILMIPINEKILQLTVSSMSLPQDQLDIMVDVTHRLRYLQVAGTIIMYLVMFLFYAFLLYLIIRISKIRLDYKKVLQLLVCSYLVVAIGDLVNTTFIYIRGLDAIENMYDIFLTGLNSLTSVEQAGVTGYVFLGYINPFRLWYLILLSIGLKTIAEIQYVKSLIISLIFWLITILIPVLSVYFSELAMARSGIM